MKKIFFSLLIFLAIGTVQAQDISMDLPNLTLSLTNMVKPQPPSKVDFEAYLNLAHEVQVYRQNHLLHLDSFVNLSKQKEVIILDTRSKAMYDAKHVKGAINLNFADFTQENLANIIPDFDTKILIYCNNNFSDEPRYFATKEVLRFIAPEPVLKKKATKKEKEEFERQTDLRQKELKEEQERKQQQQAQKAKAIKDKTTTLTLALNIPTFINLYGYGYKNVFELADLVSVHSGKIEFEGTAVFK